jgi:glycosyltransferase involved in cell wall biosynthesis
MFFYPRRCGGLSPIRMLVAFARQRQRLALLARYGAIVTHSSHMREEYIRHGFAPERVHNVYHVGSVDPRTRPATNPDKHGPVSSAHLLFAGRMDRLKGGLTLLDALPIVRERVKRPLRVTFVGEGPERGMWQQRASAMTEHDPGLAIKFPGWLESATLHTVLATSDLLVVPSLWPEPFGKIGIVAGLCGVPAVAFDVGGIGEWLSDGQNGYLVPGNPATAPALADAIVKFLMDDAARERLSVGAREAALRFEVREHVIGLVRILEDVVRRR